MGHAHILWVYEDGIRDVKHHPEKASAYTEALGQAVLKLCLNPDYYEEADGIKRVDWHSVFNHDSTVRHADRVHSTDALYYIWARNGLRTIDQLNDDELEEAKRLFEEQYAKRKARKD